MVEKLRFCLFQASSPDHFDSLNFSYKVLSNLIKLSGTSFAKRESGHLTVRRACKWANTRRSTSVILGEGEINAINQR